MDSRKYVPESAEDNQMVIEASNEIKLKEYNIDLDEDDFCVCRILPSSSPKVTGISANNVFTSQILAARYLADKNSNRVVRFNDERGESLPYSEDSTNDNVVQSSSITRKS